MSTDCLAYDGQGRQEEFGLVIRFPDGGDSCFFPSYSAVERLPADLNLWFESLQLPQDCREKLLKHGFSSGQELLFFQLITKDDLWKMDLRLVRGYRL